MRWAALLAERRAHLDTVPRALELWRRAAELPDALPTTRDHLVRLHHRGDLDELASGLSPLVPAGAYCKLVRLCTTQITLNSAPFEPLREPALPRTAAFMAEQIDAGLAAGLHQETMWRSPDGGDDIFARARDIVIEKHRAAERARYIRDVDEFLPEIRVEEHPSAAGRIVVQDPMAVAGPHHQTALAHIMYLR